MAFRNVVIFASFDNQKIKDPELYYLNNTSDNDLVLNTIPSSLTLRVQSLGFVLSSDYMRITTNGIIGTGTPLSTFNIPKINYVNQKIPLVATVVDLSGNAKKNVSQLTTRVQLNLLYEDNNVVPNNLAVFTSNFTDVSTYNGGGFYKGSLTPYVTGENMRIKAVYTSTTNVSITGVSNYFNIYPSTGTFNIRKINENNNQQQNYKNLIYQEALNGRQFLFDKFLGQIVGSDASPPETIGIKVFEKTANFVANNGDPDYSNLNQLFSLLNELNIPYEEYNQEFPPSLQRIADILSVNVSRQRGGRNQFQLNFNDKGFSSKLIFGKNKGDILPVETTILPTGSNAVNIVAYEKFSEQYTLVNTNVANATNVTFISSGAVSLSSYNSTWGWGLVLPLGLSGVGIKDYYDFYSFDDTIEGTYLQKFIDFDNVYNTYITNLTSYNDYAGKWGIAENVISYNLYTNLNLVSGT